MGCQALFLEGVCFIQYALVLGSMIFRFVCALLQALDAHNARQRKGGWVYRVIMPVVCFPLAGA